MPVGRERSAATLVERPQVHITGGSGWQRHVDGEAEAQTCAGVGVPAGAGWEIGDEPLKTEPGPRWPMTASTSEPTMNSTANTVVSFVSSVAPARAPNAV